MKFCYRRVFKYKLAVVLLISVLFFVSCQTYHPLHKYNYFVGSTFYNDSLDISIKYFGDINFKPLHELNKRKIKHKIEEIQHIDLNDLLVYGTTNALPEYNILMFFEKTKERENDATETINLILQDSVKKRILYKKRKGNKIAYFLLEAKNDNESITSIINDGLTISKSLSYHINFDTELTYSKVFEQYKNNNNYLLVRQKLKEAPIPNTEKGEWMQFQFLATVNSFMSNNKEYDRLIKEFESSRKKHLKPILDTLLSHPKLIKNNSVIEKIAMLSKNTRVVMLNENHWYPKHRKFAIKLLKPLKDEGYTHLALEALYKNEDSIINNNNFPSFNSGYYIREPFFGHLIRKAKDLGFTVIGYENTNDKINRELGQAQNLKSILVKNPNAKLFVYAGLDHIIEEKTEKGKRMATRFKEITNIDPLTINQVDLVSDTLYEMVMIPYQKMKEDEIFNKKVDFFVINNLDLNYSGIYPNDGLKEITVRDKFLENYKNRELLVSVYNQDEYSLYRSKSVPIMAVIKKNIENNSFQLNLPKGSFVVIISTVENDKVFFKKINVE